MVWVQDIERGAATVTLDTPAGTLEPVDAQVALESALTEHQNGNLDHALHVYQQVMGLDRDNVPAMIAAGLIHMEKGENDAAEFLLKRSITVAPTVVAYNSLGMCLMNRREWDQSVNAYRASLALDPTNATTWPNLLFALDLHPWATPALRLAERRAFNEAHCRALTEAAAPHTNDPDPDRVLRIGYVSADFKQHSAAHGFGPVIMGHHKDVVKTYLYNVDQGPPNAEDLLFGWFQSLADEWRDVRGLSDGAFAEQIRGDQIDILVDLSGYSAGGRPLTFARKPAPIQISGFGYATGMGIDAMDYVIADDVALPEAHERWYHEKPLRLPVLMGYEKAPPWPEIGPPPRLRNGYVTYGYLGRTVKLSPQTLATWAEILAQVPESRLLFKCDAFNEASMVTQVKGALSALGVHPDRVELRLGSTRYDHIATYNDVDISLDPSPHGGGVTTIDSLLMGCPTVTLLGNYLCGRTGASILTALGFQSAIGRTPFEYVKNAVEMAADDWTLEDRQGLRRRLTGSILFDDQAYAGAVEDAYRLIWRAWCDRQTAVLGAD